MAIRTVYDPTKGLYEINDPNSSGQVDLGRYAIVSNISSSNIIQSNYFSGSSIGLGTNITVDTLNNSILASVDSSIYQSTGSLIATSDTCYISGAYNSPKNIAGTIYTNLDTSRFSAILSSVQCGITKSAGFNFIGASGLCYITTATGSANVYLPAQESAILASVTTVISGGGGFIGAAQSSKINTYNHAGTGYSYNSILAANNAIISASFFSAIIGGDSNNINGGIQDSVIVGGVGNTISAANRSIVLGSGLTTTRNNSILMGGGSTTYPYNITISASAGTYIKGSDINFDCGTVYSPLFVGGNTTLTVSQSLIAVTSSADTLLTLPNSPSNGQTYKIAQATSNAINVIITGSNSLHTIKNLTTPVTVSANVPGKMVSITFLNNMWCQEG